jgi:hypothetical protein
MTTTRHAQCSCGQLKLEADGDPVRISMCHCIECQRRTGSVFGAQARFPKENVRASGPSKTYTRKGDSGHAIHFHFCPTCGSTVYYTLDRAPDGVAVALGAFADPTFPAPKVSVYEARKHAWVGLPDGIEHMD